jgi:hypothetical protein
MYIKNHPRPMVRSHKSSERSALGPPPTALRRVTTLEQDIVQVGRRRCQSVADWYA